MLEFTLQPVRCTSSTTHILHARTSFDDFEEETGAVICCGCARGSRACGPVHPHINLFDGRASPPSPAARRRMTGTV